MHIRPGAGTIYESTASALSNPWKKRVRVDTISKRNFWVRKKLKTKWPKLEKKLYKKSAEIEKTKSDIKRAQKISREA